MKFSMESGRGGTGHSIEQHGAGAEMRPPPPARSQSDIRKCCAESGPLLTRLLRQAGQCRFAPARVGPNMSLGPKMCSTWRCGRKMI